MDMPPAAGVDGHFIGTTYAACGGHLWVPGQYAPADALRAGVWFEGSLRASACLRQVLVRRTKGFLQARLQRPFRPTDRTVHRTARPQAPRGSSDNPEESPIGDSRLAPISG
jgi:hypothetical protein